MQRKLIFVRHCSLIQQIAGSTHALTQEKLSQTPFGSNQAKASQLAISNQTSKCCSHALYSMQQNSSNFGVITVITKLPDNLSACQFLGPQASPQRTKRQMSGKQFSSAAHLLKTKAISRPSTTPHFPVILILSASSGVTPKSFSSGIRVKSSAVAQSLGWVLSRILKAYLNSVTFFHPGTWTMQHI